MDGTHLIDRLLWIFGNDVASVSGITSNFCFPDVDADDTGMCLIRWKSGKAATISRIGWETGRDGVWWGLLLHDGTGQVP